MTNDLAITIVNGMIATSQANKAYLIENGKEVGYDAAMHALSTVLNMARKYNIQQSSQDVLEKAKESV